MTSGDRADLSAQNPSRRALEALTGTAQEQPPRRGDVVVGREVELAELDGVIAAAHAGRGMVVLVCGEAGIGKSRLAEEALRRAAESGTMVLRARCWEAGGAPSYWPWIQLLRNLSAHDAALRAKVDELLTRLRPAAPHHYAGQPDRFDLVDELVSLFLGVSRSAPVVLLIDDLHAADESSLVAVQLLAAQIRSERVAAIATYRHQEARERPAVSRALDELSRDAVCVDLGGLDVDAVRGLIASRTAVTPSRDLAANLTDATGGNPFFIDQIIRMLDRGELTRSGAIDVPIPEQVREALRWRLEPLAQDQRALLDVAAVVGREFEMALVADLAAMDLEPAVTLLDEAVAAGLVAPSRRHVRFEFTHSLVRETLYEDLLPAERMKLHRLAAQMLERRGDDAAGRRDSEIAHHYVAAAPLCDTDHAIAACRRAAEHAKRIHAYGDAAAFYQHVVDLLGRRRAVPQERCDALLDLGNAQYRAGNAPAARATFRDAAEVATAAGLPEALARATLGYGAGLGGYGFADRADEELIAMLERALDVLEEGDSVLRVRALARLAVELYYTPLAARRDKLSAEALAMAERLEDTEALLVARYSRHWSQVGPDDVTLRADVAEDLVALATQVADPDLALRGQHLRLVTALELGDVVDVDYALDRYARLVEQLRQPVHRWHLQTLRSMRAFIGGDLAEAERLAFEALELGRLAQGDTATLLFGVQLCTIRWAQGRIGEVEPAIRLFVEQYPESAWQPALLIASLAANRTEEARALFDRVAADDFADVPRDGNWLTTLCMLSVACAAVGDASRAKALRALLLPYEDRIVVANAAAVCYGSVGPFLGLLASTMGELEEAERHYQRGLIDNLGLGHRPQAAWALLQHAIALHACEVPALQRRAREMLVETRSWAASIGMDGVVDTANRLLAQPVSEDSSTAPVNERMFRREGDYWSVRFSGSISRLRDGKGPQYLAQLLRNPNQRIAALDLVVAGGNAPTRAPNVEDMETLTDERGSADLVLDAQAKRAYERRLRELQEDLEEAQAFNDPERAATLQEEMDALVDALRRAVGLGGRSRAMATPGERARVSVTKVLKQTIRKLAQQDEDLGRHLESTVRTGAFCSYTPDPGSDVSWIL